MKLVYLKVFLIIFSFVLFSCGGSNGGGDDTPPPPPIGGGDDDPVVLNPTAATLVFPENNKECTQGNAISNSESIVTFEWNASENTDNYVVTLRNLNSQESFNSIVNSNTASITILRATPYEWFVTSRANGTNVTAESSKWKFYNEGPGLENYAPFPAQAVAPPRGSTLPSDTETVTLEWSSTDVDNDIEDFEIYFKTENEDSFNLLGTQTENSIEANVNSGTIYSWYVVSNDSKGNSSESERFSFKVEE